MSLVPGKRLGPYEVLSPLGAGGMGEVWRARDTRLARDVAIKVLPRNFGSDAERLRRFEQEARTLATLSHPNVLVIHDVGAHGDAPYLVMELLVGQTLRERLASGSLPPSKALELGVLVARGLSAAHEKGIIHRDLKPENVFLTTDGGLKVLDFGLAKRGVPGSLEGETGAPTQDPATHTGSLLGTIGYMSPEQVRGEAVDARSDVFALGALLYEMLSGRRAFKGDSPADTFSAILKEDPPDLESIAPKAMPGLVLVVRRCLEKRREDRFSSARDVSFALLALSHSSAPGREAESSRKSVVVLPFVNLSSDPEQEFFSDGLTEEVISTLSKLGGLMVISRNSAMTLKGAKKTTQEIGQLLHVSHVLEGSVRKAGNNLRITAQLIDAASDAHLWAERYSGTLDDIFDIQEQVARAIAEALKVTLSPDEERRIGERPIADVRVYECCHRARQELRLMTKEGLKRGVRTLQQGLDVVGDHPLLQVGIAQAHLHALEVDLESREEALRAAAAAVERARSRDPRYVQGTLAGLERATGNLVRALRYFENAVVENPEDTDALFWLSFSYVGAGKAAAALAVAERLIGIDPLTISNHVVRGWAVGLEGGWDRMLAVLDGTYEQEPEIRMLSLMRMVPMAWLGRWEDACRLADATVAENADDMFAHATAALKHALLGQSEPVIAFVDGPLRSYLWHDPDMPWLMAGWLTVVHEHDRAYTWLERWLDRGAINYPVLASLDPFFEPLRGELRFQRLLDRVKPEWERFVPRFGPGSWGPVASR